MVQLGPVDLARQSLLGCGLNYHRLLTASRFLRLSQNTDWRQFAEKLGAPMLWIVMHGALQLL